MNTLKVLSVAAAIAFSSITAFAADTDDQSSTGEVKTEEIQNAESTSDGK